MSRWVIDQPNEPGREPPREPNQMIEANYYDGAST